LNAAITRGHVYFVCVCFGDHHTTFFVVNECSHDKFLLESHSSSNLSNCS